MRDPTIVEVPPGPDWLILKIDDRGPSTFYRFAILGENLNYKEGSNGRMFNWSVRDIRDSRFAAHPDATPDMKGKIEAAKQIAPR